MYVCTYVYVCMRLDVHVCVHECMYICKGIDYNCKNVCAYNKP